LKPCREALQLVALPKCYLLERGEEPKGVRLLLCEALHLFVHQKSQIGERGREQGTDGRGKDARDVICLKLLQFGGRGWELLFMGQRGLGTSEEIGGSEDS